MLGPQDIMLGTQDGMLGTQDGAEAKQAKICNNTRVGDFKMSRRFS